MAKYSTLALLWICLAVGLHAQPNYPAAAGFDEAGSSPEAIAVANAVMEASGGYENWKSTHYISWTLFGQHHLWDKRTGMFRHERDSVVTIMNLSSQEGKSWAAGAEITDPEMVKKNVEGAYRSWVNEGYWTFMPFKLKDSGVTLTHHGTAKTMEGREADALHLTFKDVGLTPQNKYRILVDKESRLMTEWSFYPSADDAEPRFTLPWADYREYGGIKIANDHGLMGDRQLKVTNLAVNDEVPAGAFEGPADTGLFGAK